MTHSSAWSSVSGELSRVSRVSLGAVFLLLTAFALRQVGSPDLGFHLATGRSILVEKAVPRFDTFTYTIQDHPYIDTSWGYDLLVALIHAGAGIGGVVLFHAACYVLAFAIAVRTARLGIAGPVGLVVASLLAVLLSESRLEARPEALSYVLFASILYLLQRRAQDLRVRLWLLVPLFLVWSNVHALYLVGWGALACFNVGAFLRRRAIDRSLLLWSGLAAAAALLNPYGWRGLGMSLLLGTRLGGGHLFHQSIGEYESPFRTIMSPEFGFYLVPILSLFVFLALALGSLPALVRSRRFESGFLVLVFAALALGMVRNAPLLAIAGLPAAAAAFPPRAPAGPGTPEPRGRLRPRLLLAGLGLVAVLFALRVITDAYYIERRRLERFGWDWNGLRLPVAAARYAARVPLAGRMLNDLNDGGYLIHALSRPVFIDGRLEVVGEEFFEVYRGVFTAPDALAAAVDRHRIGWVLFPYRDRPDMLQMLSADSGWALTYVDGLTAVFARRETLIPAILDVSVRQAPPALDLDTVPGLRGRPRSTGVRRWGEGFVRRQAYPAEEYSLGVFHYLRGDGAGLAGWTAQALRRSGGTYGELYGNLGFALHAMGALEDARACLAIALGEVPFHQPEERRRLAAGLAAVERDLARSRSGSRD